MKVELIKSLQAVQKEIPVIKKNAKGYNYKYADLPQVWSHIHNVLEKNGFVVVHSIRDGSVTTFAIHEHGEMSSVIPLNLDGMKPQEIGSEITYYKRYNLCALFNIIIEGEDDDAATAQKKVVPKATGENCPDCGSPMKARVNGSGSYCPKKYPITNPACPPKKKTEWEKKAIKEIDNIPVIE